MPWDMFCNQCCATLVGDMCDGDDEEMEASYAEYNGAIIYCSYCDIYMDFNSGNEIDLIPHLHRLFNKQNAIYEVKIINGG